MEGKDSKGCYEHLGGGTLVLKGYDLIQIFIDILFIITSIDWRHIYESKFKWHSKNRARENQNI